MFDKIPSLKDFILYVIPGIITCYFVLDIFIYFKGGYYQTNYIFENSSLSFIGVIFAFLIGFLMSQAQIIFFWIIYKKELESMRTISNYSIDSEIKTTLKKRIKKVFDIENIDENDNKIVFLCLNYVKVKTNDNSNSFVDRNNNLSSFAISIFLPIIIVFFDLFLHIGLSTWIIITLIIVFVAILLLLVKKIVFNFRDEYYKSIFRQFMVLSE